MAEIQVHAGMEWWQADDGSWWVRQVGTEEWELDQTNQGPSGVRTEFSVANTDTGIISQISMADPGERFRVIESETSQDGTVIEVLEYKELLGSSDVRTSEALFFTQRSGAKLKMVRIRLKGSKIRVEPGALYFMKGSLEMTTSTGGGVLKGLKRKMLSGETFFVNEIHGVGEVYLEPTFGHFILHKMHGDQGVICDKGLFFAGAGHLDVGAKMQGSLSAGFFGGEGWFQTHITGQGVAVLYSPVPKEEIMKYQLAGDKLFVDGNFALMRSESILFKTQKSSKGIMSTMVSGEGLLQTFEGTGFVWIAPTQGIYEMMSNAKGMGSLANNPTSMGTNVKLGRKGR